MVVVAILGAAGRVGKRLVHRILDDETFSLAAAVGRADASTAFEDAGRTAGAGFAGIPIGVLEDECFFGAEVVIDFSQPDALIAALPFLNGAALVTGTTGLTAEQDAALDAYAKTAPVVAAANFSAGVTVLADLVARAAKALPDADIEVVESHHRHKVDAPSGTALFLAQSAANARGVRLEDVADHGRHGRTGERVSGRIGMHALRMGDVVGEHEVWLASEGDRLRLGHVATSRDTFAVGALRAAVWARGKAPGRYTMQDVLGLHV
jgi:4-hydroxy-tetrahydrodipicolinate reductase